MFEKLKNLFTKTTTIIALAVAINATTVGVAKADYPDWSLKSQSSFTQTLTNLKKAQSERTLSRKESATNNYFKSACDLLENLIRDAEVAVNKKDFAKAKKICNDMKKITETVFKKRTEQNIIINGQSLDSLAIVYWNYADSLEKKMK